MEYDKDKADDITLALLYLVMHHEDEYGARAWRDLIGIRRIVSMREDLLEIPLAKQNQLL